ncbi:MAG TPA: TIGR02270 family protein [Gemmataceae bacterium]|nr:TIGR02270 family protein [Gemmataceae bacterium]
MESPVIPAILDRYAEEAAFLWLLRDGAVGLPQFTLQALAELDQRVESHLDGLRLAGEHGRRRAWQEFENHAEPGEAFAAATLAFEAADPAAIQKLLEVVEACPALGRGVVSAVGWLTDDAAALALPLLDAPATPTGRRIGLAGAAVRRMPIPGRVLDAGLRDPRSRARAIKAIGELGNTDRLSAVRDYLNDPDLDVRFAAAWTVARVSGDPGALAALQAIAVTESRYRQRSAALAVRRLDPAAARRWVEMLWKVPGCERVAIQAAGALGDPVAVPRLLEKLAVPALARLAGEALGFITGVRIGDDRLDGPPPEGFEAGPTDDADDERVDLDPDDGLDWPDPEKTRKWWAQNQGRFSRGSRYLCGQPITPEHLKAVLREGYQRQRAAAALELALLHPREPLFEVRAPGWRQRVT